MLHNLSKNEWNIHLKYDRGRKTALACAEDDEDLAGTAKNTTEPVKTGLKDHKVPRGSDREEDDNDER